MSALLPFLAFDQPCVQVQTRVTEQLTEEGFRVKETFDLQIARLAHPDCACPHHGTEKCNCQLVVLLVYRKHETPTTLVIHGQNNRTWISLASAAGKHTHPQSEAAVRRTLTAHLSNTLSPIEVANEA